MRAVSNTSPVSNLAIIGRLELLQQHYGEVRIPPAVEAELARLSYPDARTRIETARRSGWLLVEPLSSSLPRLSCALDPGEQEAIALALALHADVLLMDERRGRAAARQVGLTVAGVLGELLHAKFQGTIPAVRPELDNLRRRAGFFIDRSVEQFVLNAADER